MATNKKKPIPPRKTAKPPVINLKATEVKAAKSTENKTSPNAKAASNESAQTKTGASKTVPRTPKPGKAPAAKKAAAKPGDASKAGTDSHHKPTGGNKTATGNKKPEPKAPKAPKAKSRKGLILVSLAALVAAGVGGAWLFKQYGSAYFASPAAVTKDQVAALSSRIDTLEKTAVAPKTNSGQTKALSQEIKKQLQLVSANIEANKQALAANNKKISAIETSINDLRAALTKAAKTNDQPTNAANVLQFKEMGAKIAGIEKSVSALKTAPVSDNSKTVLELQAKLVSLQTSFTSANEAAVKKTAELNKAIAELSKKAATPKSDPIGALARAFTVLRAKVTAGKPFESELDEVAKLLPSETAIDTLRPFAKTGAPTLATLKVMLDKVSITSQKEQPKPDQGTDLLSGLTKNLSGLVKVSKVGATDWAKAKSDATAALQAGQIVTAIKSLSQKNATKSVTDWLALANKKRQVDKAIGQMSSVVMARLTDRN